MPYDVIRAVFALALLYVGGYFVFGVALVWMGEPLVDSFTASLACLGNIGPGFEAVGPMGSFAHLTAPAKLTLVLAMWIGRLEILTVVALLHPDVWRRLDFRPLAPPPRGQHRRTTLRG